MKLSPEGNLEEWGRWKHCGTEGCVVWAAFALALGQVRRRPRPCPGWDPPSTLRAALCWGGNARALGFLWPSFWLVFPHLIPAQHSEADQVQRGHDFSKVIPRVVAETGRVSELQTVSKGCFSHGKWSQGYREGNRRVREFRIGISKAIPGSCSNQFCLNIF